MCPVAIPFVPRLRSTGEHTNGTRRETVGLKPMHVWPGQLPLRGRPRPETRSHPDGHDAMRCERGQPGAAGAGNGGRSGRERGLSHSGLFFPPQADG